MCTRRTPLISPQIALIARTPHRPAPTAAAIGRAIVLPVFPDFLQFRQFGFLLRRQQIVSRGFGFGLDQANFNLQLRHFLRQRAGGGFVKDRRFNQGVHLFSDRFDLLGIRFGSGLRLFAQVFDLRLLLIGQTQKPDKAVFVMARTVGAAGAALPQPVLSASGPR